MTQSQIIPAGLFQGNAFGNNLYDIGRMPDFCYFFLRDI
jgi:hypothetical protein